ncbi:hypothetical protein FHY06_003439 [Variovorax sp. BK613]|nr:hypothetical protein [Variovorax sp. BK613]
MGNVFGLAPSPVGRGLGRGQVRRTKRGFYLEAVTLTPALPPGEREQEAQLFLASR